MSLSKPLYDTYRKNHSDNDNTKSEYGIKIAGSLNELMHVVAIRSAVFLSEQECPYDEEFDGNDFCATHIVGYHGHEPIACIRARFFSDFTKLERLAVRHEFRNTRMSFNIVKAGIELARKKGYRLIYGHSQDRLVKFWSHFGAKPLKKNYDLVFSDYSYTEMVIELDPHPEPITIQSDPYQIIRQEGAWHKPGALDRSATRQVSSPLRDMRAA